MIPFPAQYHSRCERCDFAIHAGDLVTRDAEFGWTHVDCTPADDDAATPCQTCWLTACDCGKDL